MFYTISEAAKNEIGDLCGKATTLFRKYFLLDVSINGGFARLTGRMGQGGPENAISTADLRE
jgi:hypothetical protein